MVKNLYSYSAVDKLIADAVEIYGADVYTVEGSLLDNYIITGEKIKTFIVKEVYLNEWASAYSVRAYEKTPEKYEKIIELLENGEEERAAKLFFN